MIGTDAGVIVCYNEENDTSFRIPPQVGYTELLFFVCFGVVLYTFLLLVLRYLYCIPIRT